ncbi:hypothetical protein D3C72_2217620 [compost metagenome]
MDLGDHRLQLIEEAIEGECQAAQLVAAGVGEATGEVTFAFGDVFQHSGQSQQRTGHTTSCQPDQYDTEQGGDRPQAEL